MEGLFVARRVAGQQLSGRKSHPTGRMTEEANGCAVQLFRSKGVQLSNNRETSEKPASSAKDQWLKWCKAAQVVTITMQANKNIWQVFMRTSICLLELGFRRLLSADSLLST